MIAPNLHRLTVAAPDVARALQPGQFVIVRAEEDGERIPLSVVDWDSGAGTVTMLFNNVGQTTNRLALLSSGESLPTVAGPLGLPLKIEPVGHVLLVGGCYGLGSLYPLAKAYRKAGSRVTVALEARSSYLLCNEDAYRAAGARVFCITRDGSYGLRGHIERLEEVIARAGKPDLMVANGCNYLLQRACEVIRPYGVPAMVSLNTLMIDGTGMCGVCRVSVGGETRFACVDGPYFDGHAIDWQELVQRRKSYLSQEAAVTTHSDCGHHGARRDA